MKKWEKLFIGISLPLYIVLIVICFLSFQKNDVRSGARVAVIIPEESNDFWSGIRRGIREQAEEKNVRLTEYTYQAEASEDEIRNLLRKVILSEPQSVFFCARQYTGLESLMKEAIEQDIGMVLGDSDADNSCRDFFVGVDNEAAGRQMAQYYGQYASGQPLIIIKVSEAEISGAAQVREKAFLAALKDDGLQPEISEILLDQDEVTDYTRLEEEFNSLGGGHAAVLCLNSSNTILAARTIQRLNLSENIFMMGFSESDEAFDYAGEGVIDVLLSQDTEKIGSIGVEMCEDLANGSEPDSDIRISDAGVCYIEMLPTVNGKTGGTL